MTLSGMGYCGIEWEGLLWHWAWSGRAHCDIECGGATVTLGVVELL